MSTNGPTAEEQNRDQDQAAYAHKNPRWLALACTGGASLAVAGNADGALVQITQANNFVSAAANSISQDLTGDGLPDVAWTGVSYLNTGSSRASAALSLSGLFARARYNGGKNSFDVWFDAGAPMTNASTIGENGPGTYTLSITGLANVTFTDTINAINGGAVTTALAELLAETDGSTDGTRVTIVRLIFDDADAGGAALGAIDRTNVASSYSEFVPIPEPSRLALLALGAAGVLARRRRGA